MLEMILPSVLDNCCGLTWKTMQSLLENNVSDAGRSSLRLNRRVDTVCTPNDWFARA